MSKGARSVFVFGLYLLGTGIGLVVIPNFILKLFGLPVTPEVWIRLVGMLFIILGFFYVQAARQEATDFFRSTIYVRSSVIFFLGAFVLLDMVGPIIILFGVIDLIGATWTGLALRSGDAT